MEIYKNFIPMIDITVLIEKYYNIVLPLMLEVFDDLSLDIYIKINTIQIFKLIYSGNISQQRLPNIYDKKYIQLFAMLSMYISIVVNDIVVEVSSNKGYKYDKLIKLLLDLTVNTYTHEEFVDTLYILEISFNSILYIYYKL